MPTNSIKLKIYYHKDTIEPDKYRQRKSVWTSNNYQRQVGTLQNISKTSKLTQEWNSEVIQDVIPADAHITYNHIINKPTLIIVWLVGTRGVKPRFWPNGWIQCIGVCETFVYYGHKVTLQAHIKLSLQVWNACNIRNFNQRTFFRTCPTG